MYGEREHTDNTFINLENLGLRYSGIIWKPSTALKESNPKPKGMEGYRKRYGMLVMAL